MPRYYPSGKRCQVNLALDTDAYKILEQLSPSKRTYGYLVSQLLRDFQRTREEPQLSERIRALEEKVGQM